MRSLLLLPCIAALLVSQVCARARRSAEEEEAFLAHFEAYNAAIQATEDRWG